MVQITGTPISATCFVICITDSAACESSPEVGSSRNNTLGLATNSACRIRRGSQYADVVIRQVQCCRLVQSTQHTPIDNRLRSSGLNPPPPSAPTSLLATAVRPSCSITSSTRLCRSHMCRSNRHACACCWLWYIRNLGRVRNLFREAHTSIIEQDLSHRQRRKEYIALLDVSDLVYAHHSRVARVNTNASPMMCMMV
jgi:hypothetical protein